MEMVPELDDADNVHLSFNLYLIFIYSSMGNSSSSPVDQYAV